MVWFLVFILGFIGMASAGSVFNPLSGNYIIPSLGFLGICLAAGMAAQAFMQYLASKTNRNIEHELALSKIMRGWAYKYYFFFTDVYNMLVSWWEEPIVNKVIDVFKLLTFPIIGLPIYFFNELRRDPVDAILKGIILISGLAMVVVGLAGTPVTFGGSNVLTIAGIAMIASAIGLFVKESIEYAEAKTEKELVQLATDDKDEAVLIPTALLGGGTAYRYSTKFNKMVTAVKKVPNKWATDPMEMADRYGYKVPESRYWWRYEKNLYGYNAYVEAGYRDLEALKSGTGGVRLAGFYKENGKWYLGVYDNWHITKVSPKGIVAVEPAPDHWMSLASKPDFFSLTPRDHPVIYQQGMFELAFAGIASDTFNKKSGGGYR